MTFILKSKYHPTGDQPKAIERLSAYLNKGNRHQTLLGVTGSGKTFTMANVVKNLQKPTLVMSHNKTLAAQLYQEFREFFPENAVHYFVSYYDYYQPEAYLPRSDTYIEKDSDVNETIDALRHASTASILTRNDVLIVASVSCIYGIGNPEEYKKASTELRVGMRMTRTQFSRLLIKLQYARNLIDPKQGHFRVRENAFDIYLPSGEDILTAELEGNEIVRLATRRTNIGGERSIPIESTRLFPAKHFVTSQDKLGLAVENIKQELADRLSQLKSEGKILEAARLKQRTDFDMEMLVGTGYLKGIENYSRHLDFRPAGSPPHTLIDYFRYAYGNDFLVFVDESHATLPQVRGMYHGDLSRKQTLVDYGFRLPSAVDNRPLTFEEFNNRIKQFLYVSATPSPYELHHSTPRIAEQIIRPTGILDPQLNVKPTQNQIQDVITEVRARVAKGERSLVLALTKRLAEDIAEYLREAGLNAEYLHSEVKTLERPDVLKKLRTGEHDVIVGINLLREGLDLPEVSFIAILDADKEGFLRNETTLLQIIGRAARHIDGKIILYGDRVTDSMKRAIAETNRRRTIQEAYNKEHGAIPIQIKTEIRPTLNDELAAATEPMPTDEQSAGIVKELEREMKKAAKTMDFERASVLRDQIKKYRARP